MSDQKYEKTLDAVTSKVRLSQDMSNSESSWKRYIGFNSAADAAHFIMKQDKDDRCFDEIFRDEYLPLVFDIDFDGTFLLSEEKATENSKYGNKIYFDCTDFERSRKGILLIMRDMCKELGIKKKSIHIESCCRAEKISYHIKIFGARMRFTHQKFLIDYIQQVILPQNELDLEEVFGGSMLWRYLFEGEDSGFDRQIYCNNKSLRLMGNRKRDKKKPYFLEPVHGRSKLEDTFITDRPKSEIVRYINSAIPADNKIIIKDSDTLDEDIDQGLELDVEVKKEARVEIPLQSMVHKKDGKIILDIGDHVEVELNEENVAIILNNGPDVTRTTVFHKYTTAAVTLIECGVDPEIVVPLWDAHCAKFDKYSKSGNAAVFKTSKASYSCLNSIVLNANNTVTIVRRRKLKGEYLDDSMIDKDLIKSKVGENKDYFNGLLSNGMYVHAFFEVCGDIFRIKDRNYLLFNKHSGVWIEYDEYMMGEIFDRIFSEMAEVCGFKTKRFSYAKKSLLLYCYQNNSKLYLDLPNPNIIPFNNGLCYDATTDEIRPLAASDRVIRSTNMSLDKLVDDTEVRAIFEDLATDDYLDKDKNKERFYNFRLVLGYMMTGHMQQQQIYIMHGSQRNGKSMLSALLERVLGDLCTVVDKSVVVGKNTSTNKDQTDSNLYNALLKRLAIIKELEQTDPWCIDGVKKLTGDSISVRNLYENRVTANHQCKFLIHSNHVPEMPTDAALLRRIFIIPMSKRYVPNYTKPEANLRKCEQDLEKRLLNQQFAQLCSFLLRCASEYVKRTEREIKSTADLDDYSATSDIEYKIARYVRKDDKVKYLLVNSLHEVIYGRGINPRERTIEMDQIIAGRFNIPTNSRFEKNKVRGYPKLVLNQDLIDADKAEAETIAKAKRAAQEEADKAKRMQTAK